MIMLTDSTCCVLIANEPYAESNGSEPNEYPRTRQLHLTDALYSARGTGREESAQEGSPGNLPRQLGRRSRQAATNANEAAKTMRDPAGSSTELVTSRRSIGGRRQLDSSLKSTVLPRPLHSRRCVICFRATMSSASLGSFF